MVKESQGGLQSLPAKSVLLYQANCSGEAGGSLMPVLARGN